MLDLELGSPAQSAMHQLYMLKTHMKQHETVSHASAFSDSIRYRSLHQPPVRINVTYYDHSILAETRIYNLLYRIQKHWRMTLIIS